MLTKAGGASNAFTDLEDTNYFFDVSALVVVAVALVSRVASHVGRAAANKGTSAGPPACLVVRGVCVLSQVQPHRLRSTLEHFAEFFKVSE